MPHRKSRIGAIAAHCRLSPRRFGKLFREQVGMSPKRYARLQRFRRVVARAHGQPRVDWAGIATDCGFHQPHLVHEIRAFSGMTPGAYLARSGDWPAHVPLGWESLPRERPWPRLAATKQHRGHGRSHRHFRNLQDADGPWR